MHQLDNADDGENGALRGPFSLLVTTEMTHLGAREART